MVLFKIDAQRPPVLPFEGNAPRPVDVDRIAPWPRAAQRVEVEAGLAERYEPGRLVDRIEADESPVLQIGSHASALAGLEQFPQPAMPEAFDHGSM